MSFHNHDTDEYNKKYAPSQRPSTIEKDIEFVKQLLPFHYIVQESKKKGSIHCKSAIGLRKLPYLNSIGNLIEDDEDEQAFDRFHQSLKLHFKERFQETFCNTCLCYVDFTIYLKN